MKDVLFPVDASRVASDLSVRTEGVLLVEHENVQHP